MNLKSARHAAARAEKIGCRAPHGGKTLIRDFAANEKFKVFMQGISSGYRVGSGLKNFGLGSMLVSRIERLSFRTEPPGPRLVVITPDSDSYLPTGTA